LASIFLSGAEIYCPSGLVDLFGKDHLLWGPGSEGGNFGFERNIQVGFVDADIDVLGETSDQLQGRKPVL
jgi:hypothetical protein